MWDCPGLVNILIMPRVPLASATGVLAALADVRGEFDSAHTLLSRAAAKLDEAGTTALLGWLQLVGGPITLSASHYEDTYADLLRVFDPSDRVYHRYDQFMAVGVFRGRSSRLREARSRAGGRRLHGRVRRALGDDQHAARAAVRGAGPRARGGP
jgi:hypothetical protein